MKTDIIAYNYATLGYNNSVFNKTFDMTTHCDDDRVLI